MQANNQNTIPKVNVHTHNSQPFAAWQPSTLAHLPATASGGTRNSAACRPRPRPISPWWSSRQSLRSFAKWARHVWQMVATDEKYLYFFCNFLSHMSQRPSCDRAAKWYWCFRHRPVKKNIGKSLYSVANWVWSVFRVPRWSGPSSVVERKTWKYPSGTWRDLTAKLRRSWQIQVLTWWWIFIVHCSLFIMNMNIHTWWWVGCKKSTWIDQLVGSLTYHWCCCIVVENNIVVCYFFNLQNLQPMIVVCQIVWCSAVHNFLAVITFVKGPLVCKRVQQTELRFNPAEA